MLLVSAVHTNEMVLSQLNDSYYSQPTARETNGNPALELLSKIA